MMQMGSFLIQDWVSRLRLSLSVTKGGSCVWPPGEAPSHSIHLVLDRLQSAAASTTREKNHFELLGNIFIYCGSFRYPSFSGFRFWCSEQPFLANVHYDQKLKHSSQKTYSESVKEFCNHWESLFWSCQNLKNQENLLESIWKCIPEKKPYY